MKAEVEYHYERPAAPFVVRLLDDDGNVTEYRNVFNPDTAISWCRGFQLNIPLDAFVYAQTSTGHLWRSWVEGLKDLSLSAIDLEIQRLQNLRQAKMVEAAAATAKAVQADHEQKRLGRLEQVLDEYNITLDNPSKLRLQSEWRVINPKVLGSIDGLPTMHGLLIATNGVVGIMVRGPKLWAEVHVAHFIPDEGQDDSDFQAARKSRAKPVKTMEELVKELANLI